MQIEINKIKSCLLNPMMIPIVLFDLETDFSDFIFLKCMNHTIKNVYDVIFNDYEKLNRWFFDNDIDLSLFMKIDSKNPSLFISFCEEYDDKLFEFYKETYHARKNDQDVIDVVDQYRRLINTFNFDADTVSTEMSDNNLWLNKETADRYSRYMKRQIEDINSVIMERELKHHKKVVENVELRTDKNGIVMIDTSVKDSIEFGTGFEQNEQNKYNIRKEVNKLDKSQDIKLKHHKSKISCNNDEFINSLNIHRGIITQELAKLNGLNPDKYVNESKIFGVSVKNITIHTLEKKSPLFENNGPIEIFSREFYARFISLLMVWSIDHLEDISKALYIRNGKKKWIKYEMKDEYVKMVTNKLITLARGALHERIYNNELLEFFEVSQYVIKIKRKNIKNNYQKVGIIHDYSEDLSFKVKSVLFVNGNMSIDTLIKLVFLSSTNECEVGEIVPILDRYSYHDKNTTTKIIKILGKRILDSWSDHGIPTMLRIFIYSCNLNTDLCADDFCIGKMCMLFYQFIINDKIITKRINRLIK